MCYLRSSWCSPIGHYRSVIRHYKTKQPWIGNYSQAPFWSTSFLICFRQWAIISLMRRLVARRWGTTAWQKTILRPGDPTNRCLQQPKAQEPSSPSLMPSLGHYPIQSPSSYSLGLSSKSRHLSLLYWHVLAVGQRIWLGISINSSLKDLQFSEWSVYTEVLTAVKDNGPFGSSRDF